MRRLDQVGGVDAAQANAATAKDSNRRTLCGIECSSSNPELRKPEATH
jgi:hypothetical protein